jgi:hypothetical protein
MISKGNYRYNKEKYANICGDSRRRGENTALSCARLYLARGFGGFKFASLTNSQFD